MLHVGSEDCLTGRFAQVELIDQAVVELGATREIELGAYQDDSFQFVYCSYVLQEVPDDAIAMRELFRVLAPDGLALLPVPIWRESTDEDPGVTDAAERARRFGAPRSLRRYGRDYAERLARAGFQVTVDPYPHRIGRPAVEYFGLMLQEEVHIGRKRPGDADGSVERISRAAGAGAPDWRGTDDHLAGVLATIPATDVAVLRSLIAGELSSEALAARMDTTPSAIEVRAARALRTLSAVGGSEQDDAAIGDLLFAVQLAAERDVIAEFLVRQGLAKDTLDAVQRTVRTLKTLPDSSWPDTARAVTLTAGRSRGGSARPRAIVVAWSMSSNGVIRAYYLADLLRRRYDVLLIGPTFPHHGTGLWEPIQGTDLPVQSFASGPLPWLVDDAERFVEALDADLIFACKPRLPSLLLAMLLKLRTGAPVIVDVDDPELVFVGADSAISLEELERRRETLDFEQPWGEAWTQACQELIAQGDAITVSGLTLQERYGGLLVPHVRDERAFDPSRFDRDEVRAELGYTPEDRVVLFAGTAREHKGVVEIVRALEEIGDPRYKLCVVGDAGDPAAQDELAGLASSQVRLLGYQPVADVPRLTVIGDLVCLPQDPRSEVSRYQTPGKLSDALAMGVPVLASEVPPLAPFIDQGAVSTIGEAPLSTRISELLSDPDLLRAQAARGREFFLDRLSYAAAIGPLEKLISGLDRHNHELSPSWQAAYELARGAAAVPSTETRGRQ